MTRIFDLVFSGILLIILSPLFLAIAILIKLDSSKGPVFFKQERLGKEGKVFHIIKFRTMLHNPAYKGPNLTRKNDPRITHFGGFLRHSKLDELPQLINVFKGEMSVVGPRPEYVAHLKYFTEEEKRLFKIKPGIVGPGQISERHEVEHYPEGADVEHYYAKHLLHKKLALELEYLPRKCLFGDIAFVLKTGYSLLVTTFRPRTIVKSRKGELLLLSDIVIIPVCYLCAFFLRYGTFDPGQANWALFRQMLPWVISIRLFCFLIFDLYKNLNPYATFSTLKRIVKAVTISSLIIVTVSYLIHATGHPRTVFFIDALIVFMAISISRFSPRLRTEIQRKAENPGTKALVVGSAADCITYLRRLSIVNSNSVEVVGLIQDDVQKRGEEYLGCKVLGTPEEIEEIARLVEARRVILVGKNTKNQTIRRLLKGQEKGEYELYIFSFEEHDSVPRREVETTRKMVFADFVSAQKGDFEREESRLFFQKRVLVTGGGGLLGAALVRRILGLSPDKVIVIDTNENALHCLLRDMQSLWKVDLVPYVRDIRDRNRLDAIFQNEKPDIIFHCAGVNREEMFRSQIGDIFDINVVGTKNVADLAKAYGTSKFVFVTSNRGPFATDIVEFSKMAAESYMFACLVDDGSSLSAFSIKTGNLVESPQGVVKSLEMAIERNIPIILSHRRNCRRFTTVYDTVAIVTKALHVGDNGHVFFSTLGKDVTLEELSSILATFAGKKLNEGIPIEFAKSGKIELFTDHNGYVESLCDPTSHPQLVKIKWDKVRDTWEDEFKRKMDEVTGSLIANREREALMMFEEMALCLGNHARR